MAENYKVLAQGQLPSTAGILYTVPGGGMAIVSRIVLVNTDGASAHTATLYVDGTAAANEIMPATSINPNDRITDEGRMTLGATNTIQGKADAGAEVTYTIFGLEIV